MAKEISKNSQYVRFDWAIKRILRDHANKQVLEGLISVLIGSPVTIIEIMESENNKVRREDKNNRVDEKARMADGEVVIVEVQLNREADFFQRIVFGMATAVNDQIDTGQHYDVIHKIYSINILYFNFGEGDDYAYHGYMDFHGMTKQGTHFFQNLTSFGVGYFTVNTYTGDGVLQQEILDAMPAVEETEFVRWVRFDHPLRIMMDGKKQHGVVVLSSKDDKQP